MKNRYRLTRRGERGAKFYCVDTATVKRTGLGTTDRDAAKQIVLAKNQALRQPTLNLQIAKAYLAGSDSGVATRTWQNALEVIIESKHGPTKDRWQRAAREKALENIRPQIIIETTAEQLLAAVHRGTVSTNVHLRKLHNFCLDMNWLPWPLVPKRQWPKVRYGEKRAITIEEHRRIIAHEANPERKAFYQLCWHLGGSQLDVASLRASDVDWKSRTIAYRRRKTDEVAIIHFGEELEGLLKTLPSTGPLFPYLIGVRSGDRATEFKQRSNRLGIFGVTLHSYRYAWAERAKAAGYPERFAMVALGHGSKAMARAYSKHAQVSLPSLEDFEKAEETKIIPLAMTKEPIGSVSST